jgi:phage protein D/phage baseplate assembly protein gpV
MPTAVAPTTNVIEVDGTALPPEVAAQLESAIVVDRLTAPDTFSLLFADPGRDILSKAGLEVGKKVVISTSSATSDAPAVLITGEVTSVEFEFDALGARAVVRGYDRSHRLAAGRKTVTFVGMTYADIASKIASETGLTADVDATEGVHDHVFQVNQSDLDFLYGLARLANRDFRVDGDALLFKKPIASSDAPDEGDPESTQPTQLVCGDNLVEFRARMSAVGQVAKVQVRGWDPKKKEEVLGEVDVVATNAEVAMTAAQLAEKVGGQTLVVVNHGVEDQESATRLATARAEQVGSAAFEATAIAIGDPSLKAGTAVSVAGADPSLCGKWVISGSRHEFVRGTYRTALEFAGRQDRSILGLVSLGGTGGGRAGADRVPGVVTAIVDDNADPDKLGRVRLKYPWMGDQAVSFWARLAAPGAGLTSGVTWVPQVGDEVLVAFEHGDPNRPFVLAGLWNGTDTIPFDYDGDLDNGSVTYCGFTSRTGHKLSFFESSSESKIHLLTANGKVSIVLDDKNEEVKVETTGKLVIDAKQDVEIKAGGSMKLEASGQMTIKGATVALN